MCRVIDIPRTQNYQFEHEDAKISPHAVSLLIFLLGCGLANGLFVMQIADAYWHLHTQPRTSFTFEIDMRPYVEKW